MNGIRSKIIIIEENVAIRSSMCTWLSNDGYAVFECKDAFRALRLIRKIVPDLIILSTDIKGINLKLLVDIVENDQFSHILFLTHHDNNEFKRLLKYSEVKSYCLKPVVQHEFLNKVKNVLMWLKKLKDHKKLEDRSIKNDLKSLTIKKAKKLIMSKWNLSEEQAYVYIRKKSMDMCLSMLVLSEKIVQSEKGS